MDPIYLHLGTFLVGLLVGNWLALDRDKRKEFNDAAQKMRAFYIPHRENPSPNNNNPSAIEIDLFTQLLPRRKRSGFTKALENYKKRRAACEVQSKSGEILYSETNPLIPDINKILTYTKLR